MWFVFGQQVGDLRTQGLQGYVKNLVRVLYSQCAHTCRVQHVQTTTPAKIVYLVANICLLFCVPFRFLQRFDVEEGLLIFSLPGSWIFLLFFARFVSAEAASLPSHLLQERQIDRTVCANGARGPLALQQIYVE